MEDDQSLIINQFSILNVLLTNTTPALRATPPRLRRGTQTDNAV
jgi:hypothetical protein